MQESRRRRRLELGLLSLSAALILACSGSTNERAAQSPARRIAPRVEYEPEETWPSGGAPAEGPRGAAAGELPAGTLVLHVGDSFAGALGAPLAKRFRAAGLRSALEFKTASYIPNWAFGADLRRYLGRYKPDLVLITLGANELEIADPPQRARAIEKIVATIGERPCVWISPPLWKPDTGLLSVIRKHVAPCRYLDSDSLIHELPRARDKIHPSKSGREIWAEAVFKWLANAREPHGPGPWSLREGE